MAAIALHLSNTATSDWDWAESKPAGCRQAGIACEDCVGEAAEQLVSISPRLEVSQAQALFTRLYPDPACRSMVMPFVVACRQAVRQREMIEEELELAAAFA